MKSKKIKKKLGAGLTHKIGNFYKIRLYQHWNLKKNIKIFIIDYSIPNFDT